MKLIHLSDLHIGKRVNEFSMLEDQEYILKEIIGMISREEPDGVIIAGDVYDKPVPPAEAVRLFDWFLTRLADMERPVFVISGNHDSPERLSFGGRLMSSRKVFVAPVYDGKVNPVELRTGTAACLCISCRFSNPRRCVGVSLRRRSRATTARCGLRWSRSGRGRRFARMRAMCW